MSRVMRDAEALAALDAELGGRALARVIRGSLLDGIEARLGDEVSVEDVRVGRFVVVEGARHRFFSAIHNVRLANTNEDVLLRPPEDGFVQEILRGTNTYATIDLRPKLLWERGEEGVRPVKTIPPHFATVREATDADVGLVFGTEGRTSLAVGTPLDMTSDVCVDLERFVERSNAVFGKTGTGKSFLTRMLLAGVIRSEVASVLVFDMANEYGMWSTDEETKKKAPALKEMFGSRVLIFSADPESSRRRSVTPDYEVQIALSDIEVGDLRLLSAELNLSDAQIRDMGELEDRWGPDWLAMLLDHQEAGTLDDVIEDLPVHAQSVKALARNLRTVDRLPFVRRKVTDNSADRILDALLNNRHVVVEFGSQKFLAYMLVSSILTRRIHARWMEEKEKATAAGRPAFPPQLVITLEEAHKFLSSEAADQTIFGTIAREMRKYNVTLLVVDQRPSGIDEEIRSQLGTRVVGALDDDRDQSSVLEGVPDARALRVLINNLEPKRQVLLGGYAMSMPIVVEVRDYYAFAKSMRRAASSEPQPTTDVDLWER
ncbi:MAG TPA: ATP-binding protein [Actinomycetota bacterium]|jgi:DNA helicase HerA-like ATPase|nr:ATP-binding protein [Actinomycetota bacterium]